MTMFTLLRPALVMIGLFTVLTGLAYPLAMTGLAQIVFPIQANGSLITQQGKVIGAEMIGQSFASDRYFHGRPSAADYNAAASSGSNLAPTSRVFSEAVRERAAAIGRQVETGAIPVDLVTASSSGLDPHITPEAALIQAKRGAEARNMPAALLMSMIENAIEGRTFGLLGEPRINVLELNMMLDERQG
jgi:K+-transporting ATPase ATPase C chain